jgi:hypothetical protein
MDTYQNYDTTNMTPDEIMKLFKQIEWNEVKKKSIQRLKKTYLEKKEETIKNWDMWSSPLFL